jgi:hypothetical protein
MSMPFGVPYGQARPLGRGAYTVLVSAGLYIAFCYSLSQSAFQVDLSI